MMMHGRCFKSGIPFDMKPHKSARVNPFAPSLDRKDNLRGYEPDNVQMVCNLFNMGKSDCSEIDFLVMCVKVAERYKDDPAVLKRLKELFSNDTSIL